MERFADRAAAGRLLAGQLEHLRGEDLVVLGLPRGGVVVAGEVARALQAPLDVIVVRKLGVPYQPELGMGAIGEEGVRIVNRRVVSLAGVTQQALAEVEDLERTELERRARRFRGERPPIPLAGRTVVVVDDGIATGSTAIAGCRVARARGAARVVLAVPVAPPGWEKTVAGAADELVSLATPRGFAAVGQFYDDFSQTTDEEVVECLRLDRARHGGPPSSHPQRGMSVDPLAESAREAANGVDVYGDPFSDEVLLAEREEAEGVELFEQSESRIPAHALRQGSPGHESLVGDALDLAPEDEEASSDRGQDRYPEV